MNCPKESNDSIDNSPESGGSEVNLQAQHLSIDLDQGATTSIANSKRYNGHNSSQAATAMLTTSTLEQSAYFTPNGPLNRGNYHRPSISSAISSADSSFLASNVSHVPVSQIGSGRRMRRRRSLSREQQLRTAQQEFDETLQASYGAGSIISSRNSNAHPQTTPAQNVISYDKSDFDHTGTYSHQSNCASSGQTSPNHFAHHTHDSTSGQVFGHQRGQRLGSSSDSLASSNESAPYFTNDGTFNQGVCNQLRLRLRYFFMNPIDKWRTKRKFPWKLLLQIIKIIFVTIQMIMYGSEMSRFLNHEGNMLISFRELLLINWDPVREVMAYPPAAGPYAVYTVTDFYDSFDYAVKSFSNITQQSPGSFGYATDDSNIVSPINVCFKAYVNGSTEPSKFHYNYNTKIEHICYLIPAMGPAGSPNWNRFSFKKYLLEKNIQLDFDRIIKVKLFFDLRTIYLNSLDTGSSPECYDVRITIGYDNSQHDGQLLINLKTKTILRGCSGNLIDKDDLKMHKLERYLLRFLVIILCIWSFLLCIRSLIKAVRLTLETRSFFKKHFSRYLTFNDCLEFFDIWILMIIINDILIIGGTLIQQFQHYRETNFNYMICSIMYGVGIFLVWAGVLRYLSFFKKYNVVILTAKRAYPDVLRFSFCALLLYGAFCLCGWIVLGPYHLKFRSLSRTSECLFSLLNGDDMFATFATTDTTDTTIWLFSRLYLYSFITLFIYIILSLFISIIMDAYETIKECYITGMPLSDIQKFISDCDVDAELDKNDPPTTADTLQPAPAEQPQTEENGTESNRSFGHIFRTCLNCCCHRNSDTPYEGI